MPQRKKMPIYKEDPLLEHFLQEVISSDAFGLGWVNQDNIKIIRVENKSPREIAKIQVLDFPASIFTDKHFIISVYASKFDCLDEQRQKLVLIHELLHINSEKERSLMKHDKEDFRKILLKFGVDWIENTELPDVIALSKNNA